MGTPAFAVASLKAIANSKHELVGVVTAPDKPAGRGRKLQASAVKEAALELGVPILQPNKLRDEDFQAELKALKADIFVVVAFRMLPKSVWSMPLLGTFNLHASLLPQYRGAAPINWVIANGENETGLTTFFINERIDTGEILKQVRLSINPRETAGELHDKMLEPGAQLVVETLNGLEDKSLSPIPQKEVQELKEAPKIFKEDLHISWDKDAIQVNNLIRAMSPFPACWSTLRNGDQEFQVKIYRAEVLSEPSFGEPGQVKQIGKKELLVACGTHCLRLLEMQIQGKKRLNVADLLNGQRFDDDAHFL